MSLQKEVDASRHRHDKMVDYQQTHPHADPLFQKTDETMLQSDQVL